MRRATPELREFADRLIAHEAKERRVTTAIPIGFQVCERLRPQLAMLAGNGGFRAILARALVLSATQVVWLRNVQVQAEGTLEIRGNATEHVGEKEFAEGGAVLTAQLLALLEAFIGENLTVGLVLDTWPELSINDLQRDQGVASEKTK